MIKNTQNLRGHVISSCKPAESAVGTLKTEQRSQVLQEGAPCSELGPPRMHPPVRGSDFSHAGHCWSFPSYLLSHLCCFLQSLGCPGTSWRTENWHRFFISPVPCYFSLGSIPWDSSPELPRVLVLPQTRSLCRAEDQWWLKEGGGRWRLS